MIGDSGMPKKKKKKKGDEEPAGPPATALEMAVRTDVHHDR